MFAFIKIGYVLFGLLCSSMITAQKQHFGELWIAFQNLDTLGTGHGDSLFVFQHGEVKVSMDLRTQVLADLKFGPEPEKLPLEVGSCMVLIQQRGNPPIIVSDVAINKGRITFFTLDIDSWLTSGKYNLSGGITVIPWYDLKPEVYRSRSSKAIE